MPEYNDSVLTTKGLELANRALMGKAKFKLTRATTTSDDLSATQLESLLVLPNEKQTGLVTDATSTTMMNHTLATVEILFTNKDLATGYDVMAIGVYAQEEGVADEVLYAVMTAKTGRAEYMPDYLDKVLMEFKTTSVIVVGNLDNVSVAIDLDTLASKQFVYDQLNPPALGNASFDIDTSSLGFYDYPRFVAHGYYGGAGIAQVGEGYAGVPIMYGLQIMVDLKNNGQVAIPKFFPAQLADKIPDFDPANYTVNRATDGSWLYLVSKTPIVGAPTIGIQCLNAKFK